MLPISTVQDKIRTWLGWDASIVPLHIHISKSRLWNWIIVGRSRVSSSANLLASFHARQLSKLRARRMGEMGPGWSQKIVSTRDGGLHVSSPRPNITTITNHTNSGS